MASNNNKKGIVIPKELEWLISNTSEAEETRKEFVDKFFGITDLEKKISKGKEKSK